MMALKVELGLLIDYCPILGAVFSLDGSLVLIKRARWNVTLGEQHS
jgi:hypothetical protein